MEEFIIDCDGNRTIGIISNVTALSLCYSFHHTPTGVSVISLAIMLTCWLPDLLAVDKWVTEMKQENVVKPAAPQQSA